MKAKQHNSVRVVVVDDSPVVRMVLREVLNADPDIEVVAVAADPYDARDKIKRVDPDVVTLDVEMPRMDGIAFLRNIMRLRPMPVVMISSLTEKNARVTLDALSIGAVDFVTKPNAVTESALQASADEICTKVKAAADARVAAAEELASAQPTERRTGVSLAQVSEQRLVAIGASTGGTEAINAVLSQLPPDTPGVVVVQHMPAMFTAPFAKRLDAGTPLAVEEAQDGVTIRRGHAYVAPGDRHLRVVSGSRGYLCRLDDDPLVSGHRPSVDVLLSSVEAAVGPDAVGVLLTGMGRDGAAGLKALHQAGAMTIAQDEASSVVWGMPREAVERGAAASILPLGEIGGGIIDALGATGPPAHGGSALG